MPRLLILVFGMLACTCTLDGTRGQERPGPLPAGALARTRPLLARRGGAIHSLAFSPDGKLLASIGSGQPLGVWDTQTGKARGQFDDYHGNHLVWRLDGKALALCSWWQVVVIVDPATGAKLQEFGVLNSSTGVIALSADGKRIASVGDDRHVRLWDVAEQRETDVLRGHEAYTSAVAFSPDGNTVASGSLDQTLRHWDAHTGKPQFECSGHEDLISCVAFTPDGKTVASGSWDATIRLWDAKQGKPAGVLRGHTADVVAVALAPDNRTLVSASVDGTVRVWDIVARKEIRSIAIHTHGVFAMALTSDGGTIATGDASNAIQLWDAKSGQQLRTLRAGQPGVLENQLSSVDVAPDGRSFVTGGGDGAVRLWDAATGAEQRVLGRHQDTVWGVAYAPDGKTVASVARRHGVARLWDVASGKMLRGFKGPMGGTSRILFSRDGAKLLAAGGSFDSTMFLWDTATGRELTRFKGHANLVSCITLSPDGKLLASIAGDQTQRIWDTRTGLELRQFQRDGLLSQVFTADSKTLIGGDGDGCRAWDAASWQPSRLIADTQSPIVFVARSGNTLATAQQDGAIVLRELSTGLVRRHFAGTLCRSLAFSADGRRMVSISEGVATVWDVTGLGPQGGAGLGPWTDQQLDTMWKDLAGPDAQQAFTAMWKLQASPVGFPTFFKARLRHLPVVPSERLAQLIRDLDAERSATRDRAMQELARIGGYAAEALLAAQKQSPSRELHRRVDLLLAKLEGADQPPDRIQALRALEVLERVASPQARAVLESISQAPVDYRVKMEAKAVLER